MKRMASTGRVVWLAAGLLAALSSGIAMAAPASAPDLLGKTPSWKPPAAAEVKAQALEWLEKTNPDMARRAKAALLWASLPEQPTGGDLLNRLTETFALADVNAARLVELCSKPRQPAVLPSQPWLQDLKAPPLLTANLRLFYGRWLVQASLLDEAQEQLASLNPSDVVAPAELLFYQGVVYHGLLDQAQGMKAIDQLLDGAEASPRRYVAVARLMQADLDGLKPDTLDHIARRMEDIQRRLELGRAGPKVRKIEDGVVESLDKIIKKVEEEQQKQQQQSGNNGNSLQPSNPAQDSRPMNGKGPGEVTKRNIGSKSGWGDLPPKERDEAIQQIGRDFPSHYRDGIEQYFRRLAAEDENSR
jgi:hypothetical protein